ncbi:HDIG domain-containing metalloprotein [Clostridium psychrophilum]|uniref:HDIG domain-containing metalloprotein n=1 Tax=Clostridium psychrophilum TaxID=132926 RepID=UPI001C0DA4BF|nr:HDIG domain-containing metalloprotein [Clostridium psychrophilum]MBU3182258.1 HDIG domain-containing protein [Clostridium psychrophilum]
MDKDFEKVQKHLMEDEKPSVYFNEMINKNDIFTKYPYMLISDLIDIPQSPEHHPEGNVWKHTMLVIDNAAKVKKLSQNPRAFMWGALLHDLGKKPTTKIRKGKITSYGHDTVGAELSAKFLEALTDDNDLINQVKAFVRWHMQTLFVTKKLPYADIQKMTLEIPFKEIALLSQCDRLGRGSLNEAKIKKEKENINSFVHMCEEYLKPLQKFTK